MATPTHQCPQRPRRRSPNRTQERRLQEKREHAFHDKRLADDAARRPRERRPVGAELEFHRDAGHDAEREVDPEDLRPKARDLVVAFVGSRDGQRLDHDDEWRQAHRELWEEIVERHREGELQAVHQQGFVHALWARL
jgi:hypothetical protein